MQLESASDPASGPSAYAMKLPTSSAAPPGVVLVNTTFSDSGAAVTATLYAVRFAANAGWATNREPAVIAKTAAEPSRPRLGPARRSRGLLT